MHRPVTWVVRSFPLLAVIGIALARVPSVAAEQYAGPNPAMGPAGTSVTIHGNLIGCYAAGPGEESSTWGFPDRVVYRWSDAVLTSADGDAFTKRVQAAKVQTLDEPGLSEVASHSFADGQGGWTLTFAAPAGDPGMHYGVLSFEPRCNFKSQAHPDGDDHNSENAVMGFCITDASGACPAVSSSTVPKGTPVGGGYNQVGSHTPGIDILGGQIRRNYIVGGVCVVAIIVVTLGAGLTWLSGGSILGAAGAGGGGGGGGALGAAAEQAYIRRLLAKGVEKLSEAEYQYLLKRGLIKIVR